MFTRSSAVIVASLLAATPVSSTDTKANTKPFNFQGFKLEQSVFSNPTYNLYCTASGAQSNSGTKFSNTVVLSLMQQLVTPDLDGKAPSLRDGPDGDEITTAAFLRSEQFSTFDWELDNIDNSGQPIENKDFFLEKQKHVMQLRRLAEGYLRWVLKMGEKQKHPFGVTDAFGEKNIAYSLDRNKMLDEVNASLRVSKLFEQVETLLQSPENKTTAGNKRYGSKEIELRLLKEKTLAEAGKLLANFLAPLPQDNGEKEKPVFSCIKPEKTFVQQNPFFKHFKLRKTSADLLKAKPDGALVGFTRNRNIENEDTDGDGVGDNIVEQINTNLSVEATLGYQLIIDKDNFEPIAYVQYSLNDVDERFDGINRANVTNMGDQDRRQTVTLGVTGKYYQLPLISRFPLLNANNLNISYATYDFSFIRSENFNSEAYRLRLTNEHRFCALPGKLCWGSKEKDAFRNGAVDVKHLYHTISRRDTVDGSRERVLSASLYTGGKPGF